MLRLLKQLFGFFCLLATVFACSGKPTQPSTMPMATPAKDLLNRALQAHGYAGADKLAYRFTFRGVDYSFNRDLERSLYTRTTYVESDTILDVLTNGRLVRFTNGVPVSLPDTMAAKYGRSVNSVIYFASLPDKLTDAAVNLSLDGNATIKGKEYQLLRIHFDEENGGDDHDDNFLYWINDSTDRVDYLAYDYRVDGGGVRFRSAYNPRVIDGVLFSDYVNYKAPMGTPLNDLPQLYERGELKELSRIELEEVAVVEEVWQASPPK
ncbi:DUF6503 family protein [Lewinella sp. 4G2]|uniref:DUF6503 family protein n=1 Tax=Lewinella sp. 4G2 TaxID=1803372 RepID=UPI0007B4EBC2|nr:DUF6503 family protein [Lewinella sp. 4G2]OAV45611.1 hypothetical protein A3850_014410 [Lewinella sp. 4G2]